MLFCEQNRHNFYMDEHELETLFRDLESDRVERKASDADRNKIRQAVCAFANDLPHYGQPGVIFIGVNDNGACTNLIITDELLLRLADMRSDGNILPFPVLTVIDILPPLSSYRRDSGGLPRLTT